MTGKNLTRNILGRMVHQMNSASTLIHMLCTIGSHSVRKSQHMCRGKELALQLDSTAMSLDLHTTSARGLTWHSVERLNGYSEGKSICLGTVTDHDISDLNIIRN